MMPGTIVDFGSRSIKLYCLDGAGDASLSGTLNWRPLELTHHHAHHVVEEQLEHLSRLLGGLPRPIAAIGTAFARRRSDLESLIKGYCRSSDIFYETITQQREVELIAAAFGAHAKGMDIFNVGGGSIQICGGDSNNTMISFGISDLNQMFGLAGEPEERKVEACIEWVSDHLPFTNRGFLYSGGEATYLRTCGVPLSDNDKCLRRDFETFAERLRQLTNDQLAQLSPFGAGWMSGAVASNCIVLAALKVSPSDYFIASDLNVAHGIVSSLAKSLS